MGWKNKYKKTMKKFLIVITITLLVLASPLHGKEHCIQIILSQSLRPYWETAKGIKESLKDFKIKMCLVENYQSQTCTKVAVGLKAAQIVKEAKICILLLYPTITKEPSNCKCGIFLEIPGKIYLKTIKKLTPWAQSIGIIYSDPSIESYAADIESTLIKNNLKAKKIRISSIKELNKILESSIDIIIPIPDPIFSTEAVIKTLVRYFTAQRKIVIGYNNYFTEIGAPISIITDYRKTGKKTAELIYLAIESGKCTWEPAVHEIKVNQEILKRLVRKDEPE